MFSGELSEMLTLKAGGVTRFKIVVTAADKVTMTSFTRVSRVNLNSNFQVSTKRYYLHVTRATLAVVPSSQPPSPCHSSCTLSPEPEPQLPFLMTLISTTLFAYSHSPQCRLVEGS